MIAKDREDHAMQCLFSSLDDAVHCTDILTRHLKVGFFASLPPSQGTSLVTKRNTEDIEMA